MSQLLLLAEQLEVSERTLRRAANDGLIDVERTGTRSMKISPAEEIYVLRSWPLLGSLRKLLRTERNVGLAVLFGSRARGDDRPDSDIDILVSLRESRVLAMASLTRRLEEALAWPVQLVALEAAARAPMLLADALEEGRVLVDRDGEWEQLQRRSSAIGDLALREDIALRRRAAAAIAALAEA